MWGGTPHTHFSMYHESDDGRWGGRPCGWDVEEWGAPYLFLSLRQLLCSPEELSLLLLQLVLQAAQAGVTLGWRITRGGGGMEGTSSAEGLDKIAAHSMYTSPSPSTLVTLTCIAGVAD